MKFDPEVILILESIKSDNDPEITREYAFIHAVDFYNRKRYFETHEIFEFQWKKEVGNRKLFIQALIQISITMNKLYININLKGALSQAKLALAKFLVLESNLCFTQKGISYASDLSENLKLLIKLLEEDSADYSMYSPPELLSNSDGIFK